MKPRLKYFTLLSLLFAPFASGFATMGGSDTIVVVVHENNALENLSIATLQKIYMGKITLFPNGERVVLGELDQCSETFYKIVLNKTPMSIRKYWISVVFSGGIATPPIELKKSAEIKAFVKNNPGAILFLKPSMIDSNMKVLTIDGKTLGEPGYLFSPLDSQQ